MWFRELILDEEEVVVDLKSDLVLVPFADRGGHTQLATVGCWWAGLVRVSGFDVG